MKDDGFTKRVLSNLVCAVEDRRWSEVEISIGALCEEHGVKMLPRLRAKMSKARARAGQQG